MPDRSRSPRRAAAPDGAGAKAAPAAPGRAAAPVAKTVLVLPPAMAKIFAARACRALAKISAGKACDLRGALAPLDRHEVPSEVAQLAQGSALRDAIGARLGMPPLSKAQVPIYSNYMRDWNHGNRSGEVIYI